MADQVDNSVIFTLRAVADEQSLTAMEAFGKKAAAVQKQLDQSAIAPASKGGGQAASATAATTASMRAVQREAEKVKQSVRSASEIHSQSLAKLKQLYDGGHISATEYGRATGQAHDKVAMAAAKQAAAEQRVLNLREKAAIKAQTAINKQAMDTEKAAQREAKAVQRARDIEQRAIASNRQKYAAASEQAKSYGMQAKASFSEVGMGAIQAGRGFAMLGLLGKESTEQTVQGLIKIQGMFDIFKGSFEVWRKITEGMRAYRKATLAAAAAEEILAVARKKSAAVPPALPGVGKGGGAGGLGLLGGGLGAGAVGTVAAGAAAVTGVVAAGAMIGNVGGARDKTAQKMQESGWVDPDSMLGWGLQSNLPALWGGEKGTDLRKGALEKKERTDAAEKRLAMQRERSAAAEERVRADAEKSRALRAIDSARGDRAAVSSARQGGVTARRTDRAFDRQNQTALDAARKRFESAVAGGDMSQFDRQNRAIGLAARERQTQAAARDRDALRPLNEQRALAMDKQERAGSAVVGLMSQREQAEGRLATATDKDDIVAKNTARAEIAAINQDIAEASERSATAVQGLLDTERAISAEKIRAADESIRRTQDEISLRKSMIEQEQDALRTAEVRFGLLSEGQQQQILNLKDRFDQGQDVGVGGMKLLAQYGTVDEQEELEKYGRDRTAQTGFGARFAQEEPGRKEKRQQEIAGFELRLKDDREFKVTVEQDTDTIVDRLVDTINKELTRRGEIIQQQVEERYNERDEAAAQAASRRASAVGSS